LWYKPTRISDVTTTDPPHRLLVVGAHAADFVWRAAGVIAKHTAVGGEATVVALSYGERGESGELWREEGQTVERVKQIREKEARAAAAAVGADVRAERPRGLSARGAARGHLAV
jgi:LmbE family N-acetylglucosaminyl deacetylase